LLLPAPSALCACSHTRPRRQLQHLLLHYALAVKIARLTCRPRFAITYTILAHSTTPRCTSEGEEKKKFITRLCPPEINSHSIHSVVYAPRPRYQTAAKHTHTHTHTPPPTTASINHSLRQMPASHPPRSSLRPPQHPGTSSQPVCACRQSPPLTRTRHCFDRPPAGPGS
jgi:hypothetical protein